MKKNVFLTVVVLVCFGLNSFSQGNNRQATIGLDRYRNLDLKSMEKQKINVVTDDLQILIPLYSENFDQGLPAGWTISGSSAVCFWAVDATANPPGYYSAPFSLNYNNGVDFACGYNYGWATSPLIDVVPSLVQVDFQYVRSTEGLDFFDAIFVSILDEYDNVLYTENPPESPNWSYYSMLYQVPAGITKIKLEFYFDTMDGLFNNFPGVFIDNVEVYRNPAVPLSNWAIFISIFLVATAVIIRFRRIGS